MERNVQRWSRQTELAIDNFKISGRALPAELIHVLAGIKAEAATINLALQVAHLDAEVAAAIVAAAGAVEAGQHDDQFPIDIFQTGSGTSTNMNVNEVIAALAAEGLGRPVHPNDQVNASQSSNDVFPTATSVAAARSITTDLLPAIAHLTNSFDAAATRFADVVKTGRTHLMDAVPITLGAEMSGYAEQLREAGERIAACLGRLGRVPIGGTAVGNGLNAPIGFGAQLAAALARRYSIEVTVAPSRYAAQAARDGLVEASSTLRGLAIALIKIANDVRLMGSGPDAGLGELRLPELQAGSSVMPGKVNPVMCEMVTQVAVHVFGLDAAIAFAGSQGSFELNTFQPLIAANLLEQIRLLSRACTVFAERCIDGLEANEAHLREIVERTASVAAALNEALGYDRVAELVKTAGREQRSLLDVVVDSGAMDREKAAELLDVDRLARGGTG